MSKIHLKCSECNISINEDNWSVMLPINYEWDWGFNCIKCWPIHKSADPFANKKTGNRLDEILSHKKSEDIIRYDEALHGN